MKKLRIFAAAVIRGSLLLTPGVAFSIWQWHSTTALINILAAVGLETLFLLVFVFITVTVQAYKAEKKSRAEGQEEIEAESPEV